MVSLSYTQNPQLIRREIVKVFPYKDIVKKKFVSPSFEIHVSNKFCIGWVVLSIANISELRTKWHKPANLTKKTDKDTKRELERISCHAYL